MVGHFGKDGHIGFFADGGHTAVHSGPRQVLQTKLVEHLLTSPMLMKNLALTIGSGITLVIEIALLVELGNHSIREIGRRTPRHKFLTHCILTLFGSSTIVTGSVKQSAEWVLSFMVSKEFFGCKITTFF